jgi:hypothetical protein
MRAYEAETMLKVSAFFFNGAMITLSLVYGV